MVIVSLVDSVCNPSTVPVNSSSPGIQGCTQARPGILLGPQSDRVELWEPRSLPGFPSPPRSQGCTQARPGIPLRSHRGKDYQEGTSSGYRHRGDYQFTLKPNQCSRCLGFGHWARHCRDPVVCRNCRKVGHRSYQCIRPPTIPSRMNITQQHPRQSVPSSTFFVEIHRSREFHQSVEFLQRCVIGKWMGPSDLNWKVIKEGLQSRWRGIKGWRFISLSPNSFLIRTPSITARNLILAERRLFLQEGLLEFQRWSHDMGMSRPSMVNMTLILKGIPLQWRDSLSLRKMVESFGKICHVKEEIKNGEVLPLVKVEMKVIVGRPIPSKIIVSASSESFWVDIVSCASSGKEKYVDVLKKNIPVSPQPIPHTVQTTPPSSSINELSASQLIIDSVIRSDSVINPASVVSQGVTQGPIFRASSGTRATTKSACVWTAGNHNSFPNRDRPDRCNSNRASIDGNISDCINSHNWQIVNRRRHPSVLNSLALNLVESQLIASNNLSNPAIIADQDSMPFIRHMDGLHISNFANTEFESIVSPPLIDDPIGSQGGFAGKGCSHQTVAINDAITVNRIAHRTKRTVVGLGLAVGPKMQWRPKGLKVSRSDSNPSISRVFNRLHSDLNISSLNVQTPNEAPKQWLLSPMMRPHNSCSPNGFGGNVADSDLSHIIQVLIEIFGGLTNAKLLKGLSWRISDVLARADELGFLGASMSPFLSRLQQLMAEDREKSPKSALVPVSLQVPAAMTSNRRLGLVEAPESFTTF
ncbi:hypothetical protein QJS10_CPA01g01236 [Acorus calamus]|uniref:CCHC-type domain-containing protein n=1 Tax=Acorus calamus TaxID=4465 RepID=A0AAV9FFM7_ACOCL|nr:hypothetical protein QJS10_CPA01g01236 [Acorus calamus]